MIKHVVLFKLKTPSTTLLNQTKDILLSMKGRVPEVRDIEVGIDQLRSERSYDIMLTVIVDDMLALESYQRDPYHCSVVKTHMHAVREASVAIDYTI